MHDVPTSPHNFFIKYLYSIDILEQFCWQLQATASNYTGVKWTWNFGYYRLSLIDDFAAIIQTIWGCNMIFLFVALLEMSRKHRISKFFMSSDYFIIFNNIQWIHIYNYRKIKSQSLWVTSNALHVSTLLLNNFVMLSLYLLRWLISKLKNIYIMWDEFRLITALSGVIVESSLRWLWTQMSLIILDFRLPD